MCKEHNLPRVTGNQKAKSDKPSNQFSQSKQHLTRTNNTSLMSENERTLKKKNPQQNTAVLEYLLRIIFEYAGNSVSRRQRKKKKVCRNYE